MYVSPYDGNNWGQAAKLHGRTSKAMAVASFNGTLYCATRGRNSGDGVSVAQLNGTTWGGFSNVPGFRTAKAPALATHQGKHCLAAVGMDGRTHVTVHNGTAWSTTSTDLGGTTGSGPALTVRDGALYCAVRTLDGAIALDSFNGTAWTGWVQ